VGIEMKATATISGPPPVREIIKLVLPKEHGSWSLALEPIALGMLAASSAAGGALAMAALAGFFLRRPLKLALSNKVDSRKTLATGCVVALAAFATTALFVSVKSGGIAKLWPLIPAAVAGIGFVWFDSRNEAREEAAELSGAIAFGILPASFAELADWNLTETCALAMVMLSRSVPTILFVRTYLRRNKGYTPSLVPALIAAGAGMFLNICMVVWRVAPWPAALFAALFTARTFWLLLGRHKFSAKSIGTGELILGMAMVLTLAATK
jgi:hypothetical protein